MKLEEYGKWRASFEENLVKAGSLEPGDCDTIRTFLDSPAGLRIMSYLFAVNQGKSKHTMTKMTSMEDALDKNWWIGNIAGAGMILEALIESVVERSNDRPDPNPVP